MSGPSAESIQAALRGFRRTGIGDATSLVWSCFGSHRPAEFARDHVPSFLQGKAPLRWLCVYPFVRSYDWYLLPPEERGDMLREHGLAGRAYTGVQANTVSAFALTMVLWGCESLSENALVGPGEKSDILLIERDENGYTVARETDPAVGVVTAVIDQNGGSLNIGNHVLTVPAGAVDAPTTFVMTKLVDEIEVGLTATRLLPNDIGRQGFNVPLRLSLSYAHAAEVPANLSEMKVGWVKLNGSIEVQQSQVDSAGEVVVGTLDHFSAYAIVIPE
jgi:hypothetical protein